VTPSPWPCAQAENREKKWDSLVHAGVLFPPEYEPHGVRMLYEGKPVELNAEQVASDLSRDAFLGCSRADGDALAECCSAEYVCIACRDFSEMAYFRVWDALECATEILFAS